MKKYNHFMIIILILLGCSNSKNRNISNGIDEARKLTRDSVLLEGAYDNVFYKNNFSQGKDSLTYYLKNKRYDSSLFYAYHALTYAYINLLDFENADSVHKLINRSQLNAQEDGEWLDDALQISTQLGQLDSAKKYIFQNYRHPGSKMPHWIEDNTILYELWLINSFMKECDSAKYYLNKYVISLKNSERIRDLQKIDSTKIDYFEKQLEHNCPLIDSVGLNLPMIIIYQ